MQITEQLKLLDNRSPEGWTKLMEFAVATQTIQCISGFAGTVTKEGTLIAHGIKCDPRGDFCIIIPFGFSLAGIEIGDELEVIRTTEFTKENWQLDTSLERQVFRIVFDYATGDPKMMQTEMTWDTDTLEPLIKTTWPDLQLHRYDMKCQAPYWYQATAIYEDAWKIAPSPVFDGVRRRELQTRMFLDFVDDLKVKFQTESAKFDKFRNPELIP